MLGEGLTSPTPPKKERVMGKISVQDVPVIAGAYVDKELGPKAQDGLQKAMLYGGLFVIQNRASHMLSDPNVQARLRLMGVMDESGMIDIEYAYQMLKFSLEKSGNITALGITFDASDVEKLASIARGMATK